jgi:hypothetical protein
MRTGRKQHGEIRNQKKHFIRKMKYYLKLATYVQESSLETNTKIHIQECRTRMYQAAVLSIVKACLCKYTDLLNGTFLRSQMVHDTIRSYIYFGSDIECTN